MSAIRAMMMGVVWVMVMRLGVRYWSSCAVLMIRVIAAGMRVTMSVAAISVPASKVSSLGAFVYWVQIGRNGCGVSASMAR